MELKDTERGELRDRIVGLMENYRGTMIERVETVNFLDIDKKGEAVAEEIIKMVLKLVDKSE